MIRLTIDWIGQGAASNAGLNVSALSGDVAVVNAEATAMAARLGSVPTATKITYRRQVRRASRRWALRLARHSFYYGGYWSPGPSLILGARF